MIKTKKTKPKQLKTNTTMLLNNVVYKNLLEIKIFEGEVHFNYSSCFDSSSKNILFSRLIIFCAQPIKVIKKAENIFLALKKCYSPISYYV